MLHHHALELFAVASDSLRCDDKEKSKNLELYAFGLLAIFGVDRRQKVLWIRASPPLDLPLKSVKDHFDGGYRVHTKLWTRHPQTILYMS